MDAPAREGWTLWGLAAAGDAESFSSSDRRRRGGILGAGVSRVFVETWSSRCPPREAAGRPMKSFTI
jgi:hypothetical protein